MVELTGSSRRRVWLVFAVCILSVFLLGCELMDTIALTFSRGNPGDRVEVSTGPPDPEDDAAVAEYESRSISRSKDDWDSSIVFSYSGDNPSYHTGLLNKTTIYLNYDKGTAWADESLSFQEPSGSLVRNGTDAVRFNGTYDHQKKIIKGTLRIRTTGKAVDDEYDYTNTLTYDMHGELEATLVEGVWTGTVKGTSWLAQEWEESKVHPAEMSDATVNWLARSVSIEEHP